MNRQAIRALVLTLSALAIGRTALVAQQKTGSAEITVQRVWVGAEPDFYAAHPSPDGRYMSEIDWDTGDLAVIDLVSGELQTVGAKTEGWTTSDWAESSVFSPDGRKMAYVWWDDGLGDDGEPEGYSIRTIALAGGESEELVPVGVADYFLLDDWSADGSWILGRSWKRGDRETLVRIQVSDGRVEEILDTPAGDFVNASISGDGRLVAFTVDAGADGRDVYAANKTGGSLQLVLGGQADDLLLGWLPDGAGLLFYSDRGATRGIWASSVNEDLRTGEPRLLKADVWRLEPLGFSNDAYFYGVIVENRQVYTGAVDVRNGGFLQPLGPVQEASEGSSTSGVFSPDGQYLAYRTSTAGSYAAAHALVVRAVGGDDFRRIEGNRPRPVAWTADGNAVLAVTAPEADEQRMHLTRFDLATGTHAIAGPSISDLGALSADGKFAYDFRRESWNAMRVVEVELETGAERTILETNAVLGISVSVDDETLAIVTEDRDSGTQLVSTLPVAGGEPTVVYGAEREEAVPMRIPFGSAPAWTPDGQYLLIIDGPSMMRVPVAGGEAVKLVDLPVTGLIRHFRLSPDGSRFVLDAGSSKGEIWMVKGLPGETAGFKQRRPEGK